MWNIIYFQSRQWTCGDLPCGGLAFLGFLCLDQFEAPQDGGLGIINLTSRRTDAGMTTKAKRVTQW
jgi:hypothetical protein